MSDEKKLDPKRGLIPKLCEIMAAVGYLQKKGNNTSQSYKYIREADVVAKMRDEFASRNIFIFPSLVHHENVKMTKVSYDKVTESYQTNIVMRWTIVDGDTNQERVCEIPGSSASPGDKGVYVAMTGSEKYLLMKSFLLPTGDDPEDDENEEKGSKEAAKAVGDKKVADFQTQKSNGNNSVPRAVIPPADQSLEPLLQASIDAQNAKKNGGINYPPIPTPEPPKPSVERGADVDDVVGTITAIKDKKTKEGRAYKVVTVTDIFDAVLELSAFDNFKLSDGLLFQYLVKGAIGQEATFTYVSKTKNDVTYHNILNVTRIGSHRWDEYGQGVLEANR